MCIYVYALYAADVDDPVYFGILVNVVVPLVALNYN